MQAQGVDRNTLIFKSKWQPYTCYFALVYFIIIIIFNGWKVFTKQYDATVGHNVSNWSVQVCQPLVQTFLPSSCTYCSCFRTSSQPTSSSRSTSLSTCSGSFSSAPSSSRLRRRISGQAKQRWMLRFGRSRFPGTCWRRSGSGLHKRVDTLENMRCTNGNVFVAWRGDLRSGRGVEVVGADYCCPLRVYDSYTFVVIHNNSLRSSSSDKGLCLQVSSLLSLVRIYSEGMKGNQQWCILRPLQRTSVKILR